jgi:hypothetical protein
MVHRGFRRFGNLSFINQFSKTWHRLASTTSDRKGAKIQHDISWFNKNYFLFKPSDLSSDFPGLRTSAVSMTSTASMTSVASKTSTYSIHQNIYWSWWLDHPWHPNHQYQPLFVEWIIKIPIFHWYLIPFCWRLLRPADVTFSKTDCWNSNFQTSWTCYGP